MATIECTFEEFKRMAKEFQDSLPTLNKEELENAWKCIGLAYLGMSEDMWQTSAAYVIQFLSEKYVQRVFEMDKKCL